MWRLCNVDYQGKAHEEKQKPHFAVELAECLWCCVSRIIILAQNCHWCIKVSPMCFSESASTYPLLYLSFPRNFSNFLPVSAWVPSQEELRKNCSLSANVEKHWGKLENRNLQQIQEEAVEVWRRSRRRMILGAQSASVPSDVATE